MQKELGHNWNSNTERLVLGLDTSCSVCSDLAARIEERVGKRLRVRDLRDPEVVGWREQVLSDNSGRVPTLFEVEDGKVRAWSGWRMGWVLSRTIGPAATWQLVKALEEAGVAPAIQEPTHAEKPSERAVSLKLPKKTQPLT